MSNEPAVHIPGGWELRRLNLGGREIEYWAPAEPDAFLEDADTVAAHGPTAESPGRSDIPFWQYVWPAAGHMARRVFAHDWEAEFPGTCADLKALELGAGVGLVGLAALAAGLSVTFSDYQAPALEAAAVNARRNGFSQFETRLLDWNDPAGEQFPVILGCEVIYERAIHEPILDVLDFLLAPGGVAWLGDPGRPRLPLFIEDARKRGFTVEIQNSQGEQQAEARAGEFQLLILEAL